MREIKFRQPRFGANNNFVDWFYWGFIDDGSGLHFIAPLRHDIDSYQFTGLKDKSGKEIYEGDILKADDPNGEPYGNVIVEYKDSGFFVDCEDDADGEITTVAWAIRFGYQFEIIGNIPQHPELMEQSK